MILFEARRLDPLLPLRFFPGLVRATTNRLKEQPVTQGQNLFDLLVAATGGSRLFDFIRLIYNLCWWRAD